MTDTFNDFGLPAKLLKSLARMNFTTPTPIQAKTIPFVLEGRDVLGSAQTGTGKTGAFGIPLIAQLMNDDISTAIILTPTRELAVQVADALRQMIATPDLKMAVLIGGEAMPRQFQQLRQNPRIIVGTPGRVNDHLARGSVKLNLAHYLVLDEADRMLDMGFGVQIEKIIEQMPKKRQTMMFSATFAAPIIKLASRYLTNPERVSVGPASLPVPKIKQELVRLQTSEKFDRLVDELNQRDGSVIIFVKTKFGTERLAERLKRSDHRAEAIHGDLRQRQRDRVIRNFRDKNNRILVATDVAARGLDIPHIEHVINYDLPQAPEDYIHRIGRTGRAGAEGCAVNLLAPEDNSKWKAIARLINKGNPDAKLPTFGAENDDKPTGFKGKKNFTKAPWGKKRFDRPFKKREDGDVAREDRPQRQEKTFREDRPQRQEKTFREDRPQRQEKAFREDKPFREGARNRHEPAMKEQGHAERPQQGYGKKRPAPKAGGKPAPKAGGKPASKGRPFFNKQKRRQAA